METATTNFDRAQALRLQRLGWGFAVQASLFLILASATAMGHLDGSRLWHYGAVTLVLNVAYLVIIRTGLNLRLRDPSLTGAQVMLSLPAACYVMYHLEVPQLRITVVLMATVGMLFAALAFDTRRLILLGAYHVLMYVLVILALIQWAPERITPSVEITVVVAYSVVLLLIALLGSFIAGLRHKLRDRNRELKAAMAELEDLATRDPLTRLPNRRAVMEHLAHESSRAARRTPLEQSLCLCMADIDLFKDINDTYGHQAGDNVLCAVSDALQTTLRQGDFVGRFGGEEFLLMFPESTREGAAIAAERVRSAIAALRIDDLPPETQVTISLGVAVHRPGDTVDDTLRRADQALYAAKEGGRNRVVVAETPPELSAERA